MRIGLQRVFAFVFFWKVNWDPVLSAETQKKDKSKHARDVIDWVTHNKDTFGWVSRVYVCVGLKSLLLRCSFPVSHQRSETSLLRACCFKRSKHWGNCQRACSHDNMKHPHKVRPAITMPLSNNDTLGETWQAGSTSCLQTVTTLQGQKVGLPVFDGGLECIFNVCV